MVRKRIMVIAGEASGDALAAELVQALRSALMIDQARPSRDSQPLHFAAAPEFFGAGGPRLAAAGVELAFDMTAHAVVGLVEVLKNLRQFRRLFLRLLDLAIERRPDLIVCVDFSGFNRRFAHAVKEHVRRQRGPFQNWRPKIVQYVSPQVWASRPGRAEKMARDVDLLLTIFPFERAWYAQRVPEFRVEFVGHPMLDRHGSTPPLTAANRAGATTPTVVLLPGSRAGELRRHLPVMIEAARQMQARQAVRFHMVLPDTALADLARPQLGALPDCALSVGGLAEALAGADAAIASTGTVTMECAYFGVPTVALYRTSWSTYQIGKRIVRVNFLAMPNLLAGERLFPEFIQHEATPENLSREALDLLNNAPRRVVIQTGLRQLIESLGGPGASRRAAHAIVSLFHR